MTSPDAPVVPDDDGHLCNRVRLKKFPVSCYLRMSFAPHCEAARQQRLLGISHAQQDANSHPFVGYDDQSLKLTIKLILTRLIGQIDVRGPSAFHISYATGWEEVRLHYREISDDDYAVSEVGALEVIFPWKFWKI